MEKTNQVCMAALCGIDDYQHIVVKYKDSFIRMDKANLPWKLVDPKKSKDVGNAIFNIEYPLDQSQISGIKKLIDFEDKFSILKNADCRKILGDKFIFCQDFGEVMNLIMRNEMCAILHGPGGHGKSEMVNEILSKSGLKDYTFVKSFGEGLSESALYGGMNINAITTSGKQEFLAENSFLNSQIVIFEELFDAPDIVLMSLKDTLSSGFLRNGNQIFPSRVRLIIGLTNKDPKIVSNKGAAADALTQRFPIKYKVEWSNYSKDSYSKLIKKVFSKSEELKSLENFRANNIIEMFSNLMEKSSSRKNSLISPRVAVNSFKILLNNIYNGSGGKDDASYFSVLKYVEDIGSEVRESLREDLDRIQKIVESDTLIKEINADFNKIAEKSFKGDPSELSRIGENRTELRKLKEKMLKNPVHDDFIKQYQQIMNAIDRKIQEREKEILNML